MDISKIIQEVENVDPEVYDRIDQRRNVIKNFMNFSSKIAIAAVPIALGTMFNKAYAGSNVSGKIMDVLNFALSLEHLEYRFYETALSNADFIPKKDNINVIRDHEKAHVRFLQQTITAANGTPVAEAKYDFTAKGLYPNVFTDYAQFLSVAQAFEDTGVAAYKGQAGRLKPNNDLLEAALRIHSVEARHSAHIRFARRMNGFDTTVKPWIIGNDNTKGTALAPIYKREAKHRKLIFNINNIGGYKTGNAGTSSFDQQLHMNEVLDILKPFMA
ncbi:MAG: ferritin-like domain-containing protein [Ferruginibacter sp.]